MSSVQSVERAFAVLRGLSSGPAGVTELAERVDLPKSTVSRLLSTLEQLGVVEQVVVGGRYRIGDGMLSLAAAASKGRGLISLVRPHLVELTRELGEATGLSVVEGQRVHYLDQVGSDSPVQVRDWTGDRLPAHVTSSGLVLLAWSDASVRAAFLRAELAPSTSHSMTDPEKLRQRLDEVRNVGYAWAYEEFAEGLNSVAVPLRDDGGTVVAAIHAHGPAFRFPGRRSPEEIGRILVATAERMVIHDVEPAL
jgi:DNA-binding IclR family transcriptional regulator